MKKGDLSGPAPRVSHQWNGWERGIRTAGRGKTNSETGGQPGRGPYWF